MAQVDFSNAVITANNLSSYIGHSAFPSADIALNTAVFYRADNDTQITAGTTCNVYSESTSRKSFRYIGTFNSSTPSGATSFRIGYGWIVSNVVISAGDVFDFIVDVDTSVV